ncbi:MAG: hypothetical protein U0K91_11060 [Acutalibacteraceae bacterium]|nr:hypothetical protein [Acutalibacteraceae bacterium]
MYISYNANPDGNRVIDCTVRAISTVLNQTWEQTYAGMVVEGMAIYNMPSANVVWNNYLKRKSYKRYIIPDNLPEDYSVRDFCRDNPKGTFLLALSGHVVAVIDGNYYDTWDSGDEIPIYYWHRKED